MRKSDRSGLERPLGMARCAGLGTLLALALVGCGITLDRTPTIPRLYAPDPHERMGFDPAPAELTPPAGNSPAFTFVAEGVQKYECRAKDGAAAWVGTGPEARLYNADDKQVGRHYAGPTWEYQDGSRVTGSVLAHASSPNPKSVDQLLLKAQTNSASGLMARVTFVQRLRTIGGAPPDQGCTLQSVGSSAETEYTAHYVFFTPL
jgi:hypothetical protein